MENNTQETTIVFVDFRNLKKCNPHELRVATAYHEQPILAIKTFLHGIVPYHEENWTPDQIDKILKFVEYPSLPGCRAVCIFINDEVNKFPLPCILQIGKDNNMIDVGDSLVQLEIARYEFCFKKQNLGKKLKSKKRLNVELHAVIESGLIIAHLPNENYEIMRSALQKSCSSQPPIDKPQIGMAVAAKIRRTHNFRRAVILKEEDQLREQILVFFVDSYEEEFVPTHNLRKLGSHFLGKPSFAIRLKLKKQMSKKIINFVGNIIYSKTKTYMLIGKVETDTIYGILYYEDNNGEIRHL